MTSEIRDKLGCWDFQWFKMNNSKLFLVFTNGYILVEMSRHSKVRCSVFPLQASFRKSTSVWVGYFALELALSLSSPFSHRDLTNIVDFSPLCLHLLWRTREEMSRRGGSILLSKAPSESAALGERCFALLDSGYDILSVTLPELLSL